VHVKDSIKINYEHEQVLTVGYTTEDVIQSKFEFEIDVGIDEFALSYSVNGIERFAIPKGTFIFETQTEAKIIELLLSNSKGKRDPKTYKRLLSSTKESYPFKKYVEEIPNGAAALGLTFEFIKDPNSNFPPKLMGICDRILNTLDLKQTVDFESKERLFEPHRVYNTDHFNDDYRHVSLYGNCPLLYTIESNLSTGIIMLNSCDTLVDIMDKAENRLVEWTNETGVIDLYIFTSKTVEDNSKKLVNFSGSIPMPLETSLGHNQCRWNYFTQAEVEDLNEKLTEHNIPVDIIWLDIEHTNSKVYFTFDTEAFPDPIGLLDTLLKSDRQMVTQVDPHFKDYRQAEKDEKRKTEALKKLDFKTEDTEHLSEEEKKQMEQRVYEAENHYLAPEVIEKGLVVFDSKGDEFTGDCWPGTSVWIDFMNLKAQEYFGDQFLKEGHIQSLPYVQIKLDMNEPSVFNPIFECTMPKNNIHTVSHYESTESKEIVVDKFEHRNVHSLYGILNHKCTYEALINRKIELKGETKNARPFVLSRSFFIGSQKYGTMWIGDSH
jgi:mannosyl-oligosaccharide alpha-1,3-glucosidase